MYSNIYRRDLYTNMKNDLFESLRLFSAQLGAKVLFYLEVSIEV